MCVSVRSLRQISYHYAVEKTARSAIINMHSVFLINFFMLLKFSIPWLTIRKFFVEADDVFELMTLSKEQTQEFICTFRILLSIWTPVGIWHIKNVSFEFMLRLSLVHYNYFFILYHLH